MAPTHHLARSLAIFGDASLANARAFLESKGFVLPRDGIRARAWCEERAEEGDALASYVAAEMSLIGLFGPDNKERALRLAEFAADSGLASAQLLAAAIYEKEDGTKAKALIRMSVEKDYAPALYAAALKYMVDGANESEKQEGLAYMVRAAKSGYAPAQTTLASHLLESGEKAEIVEGLDLMQSAAEQGSAHARRMLAHFYLAGRYGLGVEPAKAAKLKAEAAEIESEALRVWGLAQ